MKKAYLYLENGQVFEGRSFGASGTVTGELVFTTGMTGCAESLSDPCHFGQLVVYTFPLFGNCGICREDLEVPRCGMRGVVVREFCQEPSNFRCEMPVEDFLKEQNVVGICGVDTRTLTQILRDNGVMNAMITTEESAPDLDTIKNFRITDALKNTGTKEVYTVPAEGKELFSVALLDFGALHGTAKTLASLGCRVTVFPYDTPAKTILAAGLNGIVLSDGPGDPAENIDCMKQLSRLIGLIPMLGLGLGHQLMALAAGGKTFKLPFGHHGANQPVRDVTTGKVTITAQNHGYAVEAASLSGTGGTVRLVNVNDGTCEGIDYLGRKAFSVQVRSDAALDRFVTMMKEG